MQNNIFDISTFNKIVAQKKKINEYELFSVEIPHTDFVKNINISSGKSNMSNPLLNNYFLTYGVLHEFLLLFIKVGTKIFNYFCEDIINRPEIALEELKNVLIEKENVSKKNLIGFDFCDLNFFTEIKKYNKGSDITNFTNCYNTNNIKMEILNVFMLNKITHKDIIFIKFPNITSTLSTEYIFLLTYIFNKVKLTKLLSDSFFKDSFHIIVSGVDIDRYEKVKKEIISQLKKNKIKTLEGLFINNIIDSDIDINFGEVFISRLREFGLNLEILLATFYFDMIKALKNGKDTNQRNEEIWKELDVYKKSIMI